MAQHFEVNWQVWVRFDQGREPTYRRGIVTSAVVSVNNIQVLTVDIGSMSFHARNTDCLPTLAANGLVAYYDADERPATGYIAYVDEDSIAINDAASGERVHIDDDQLIDFSLINEGSPESADERVGIVRCPKCGCPHVAWVMADRDPGSEWLWWVGMWNGGHVHEVEIEVAPWCLCEVNVDEMRTMYLPLMEEVSATSGMSVAVTTLFELPEQGWRDDPEL